MGERFDDTDEFFRLCAERDALRAELAEERKRTDGYGAACAEQEQRADAAEAALAAAQRERDEWSGRHASIEEDIRGAAEASEFESLSDVIRRIADERRRWRLERDEARAELEAHRKAWVEEHGSYLKMGSRLADLERAIAAAESVVKAARCLIYGAPGSWRQPEDFEALESALRALDTGKAKET